MFFFKVLFSQFFNPHFHHFPTFLPSSLPFLFLYLFFSTGMKSSAVFSRTFKILERCKPPSFSPDGGTFAGMPYLHHFHPFLKVFFSICYNSVFNLTSFSPPPSSSLLLPPFFNFTHFLPHPSLPLPYLLHSSFPQSSIPPSFSSHPLPPFPPISLPLSPLPPHTYHTYNHLPGSVSVILKSGTPGSRIYYTLGGGTETGQASDLDPPSRESDWVDEGGSIVIARQGKSTFMCTYRTYVLYVDTVRWNLRRYFRILRRG